MKNLLLALTAGTFLASTSFAGNWFGSGPWANATYYPGNLDGKYQAAVFGNNISGVLGFAVRDGGLPTTVTSQIQNTNSTQSTLRIDPFINYFAIFVEGRTYTGTTAAGINYNNNSVTGSLIGSQPDFSLQTNSSTSFITNTVIDAPLPITLRVPVTNVVTENKTIELPIYVTNVTPNTTTIGTTNVFETNYTTVTNTISTNIVYYETNIITGTNTIIVTNTTTTTNTNTSEVTTTVSTTNVDVPFTTYLITTNYITTTNIVESSPTITTNIFDVIVTNFTTNVTLQTVLSNIFTTNTNVTYEIAGETNSFFTNQVVSTQTNPYTWFNPVALLNRGLNGGFRATINSKKGTFTFSGNGNLSTPAQFQTVNFTTNSRGDVVSAQVETATVPFQLDGIRVSFSSASASATNN